MTEAIDTDFLRAIIAAPQDDSPRLIYADWLEENGQEERAEFIRVQCKIAELNVELMSDEDCERPDCPGCQERQKLRRRAKDLLFGSISSPGFVRWGPKKESGVWEWLFHRGFVAEITLACADWMMHRKRLLKTMPLEKVTLTNYEIGPNHTTQKQVIIPSKNDVYTRWTLEVRSGRLWYATETTLAGVEVVPVYSADEARLLALREREMDSRF